MKLINCTTLELETEDNWLSRRRPPYAILSHTWNPDGGEVTYQDYVQGRDHSQHKNWAKIDRAVAITRTSPERLNHIWIDTCCINKESSSELTESINSMFAWYAQAVVCYAQIADFDCGSRRNDESAVRHEMGSVDLDENAAYKLGQCRWFYRGWTLQELISPTRIEFFDSNWWHFGSRDSLAYLISMITGIDQDILARTNKEGRVENAQQALRRMTVAKKMSWAEARQTSRLEDQAYSLLGIFEVNMPMLYGEGESAFVRLQEEILKESNDMTLFAWTLSGDDSLPSPTYSGILARSPRDFARAGQLIASKAAKFNPDYAITNKGVRISTRLRKIGSTSDVFLDLNCHYANDTERHGLGISLRYQGAGRYIRTQPSRLISSATGAWVPERIIFMAKTADGVDAQPSVLESQSKQSFSFTFKGKEYYDRTGVSHDDLWYEPSEAFVTHGLDTFAGCVTMRTLGRCGENKNDFVIACGGSPENPWACVATHSSDVYTAALAQDWEHMAAAARRLGPRGSVAKWHDARYTNNSDFEGLQVVVKVEKVVEGVRIEVSGGHFDDATGMDNFAACCCPKTGQSSCTVL
ncbi:heterokaryon incompatibility protein-domain-containing protein [Phaeosphaeria sp. MPI-PUGE-AT-0046c]|nr:heterokaryon incompatibility protein-domain-containing protein [Phaeosphaeria sp. MPI-PUGE-AT-0046c]